MNIVSRIKNIFVADHHQPITLEARESWVVRYRSRVAHLDGMNTQPEAEIFTNEKDAREFSKALSEAFKLTKNRADFNSIVVEKQ
jgi:hypothetical protein